jgi:hypothetical protein
MSRKSEKLSTKKRESFQTAQDERRGKEEEREDARARPSQKA